MHSIMRKKILVEIKEVQQSIITRARKNAQCFIIEDLFNIDGKYHPVNEYNQEDRKNHFYDLGKLNTLKELLVWVQ